MTAESIRAFFHTIFGSRRIAELKAEINFEREAHAKSNLDNRADLIECENRAEYELTRVRADCAARIADAHAERDYFRARADRLELRLLTPQQQPRTMPRSTDGKPLGGRKSWLEVQAEWMKKQEEQARQEAAAKKAAEAH